MDKEKTGEYIRNLRKKKGWTQMQLAEQLHISDKAVSKWERGISFPDIELMEELAQVFQVDVADIIRGEEAGRAEHTVNELVKDTIDIAKREKKRQIRKYRWVLIYVRETDANGKNPGKVYRLAQDDAIPVTLPDGSAGSFKDIKEGQHIQIWYLGHRVLWKNAWIPGVEEVEITKDVWSPSDRVCVRATLQIQDSYGQIVGISNVEICGSLATGVSKMKASTPKICADGSYATVEVTYKYKGKNYHEIGTFYPN